MQNISLKLSQNNWNEIEKKFNNFELKVIECLKLLGCSANYEVNTEHLILGEEMYFCNRQLLKHLVPPNNSIKLPETVSNDKKHTVSSTEKIIFENSQKRAKQYIEEVLKTFQGKFQPKYAFQSDYIEIKGIGLLYAGHYLSNNSDTIHKLKNKLNFIFTIMVSIDKFIHNCHNLKGKNLFSKEDIVSTTLLLDLQYWLNLLKSKYKYDGFIIYDYVPELLIYTDYDKAIPNISIKPREHQIDLLKNIKECMDCGFLFVYNPLMGSGKTTVVVSVVFYIENLQKQTQYPNMQLIFVCNLPPVRSYVASLCYNAGIKFGIGSKTQDTKYVITDHFSCNKSNRRVIITSPEVAIDILKDSNDENNYMLFLDEPTVDADCHDSDILKTNMLLMTYVPKRTILSSATFPNLDLIPNISDYFRNKYKTAKLKMIYSNEIQIGCSIKTFNFDIVVSHNGIKNDTELKDMINTIKTNPFLGRIYTSDVVRKLQQNMSNSNIQNTDKILDTFRNVNNMTSDKVRKTAIDMLETLSQCEDLLIETVCKTSHINTTTTLNIDFYKFATSQAWIMQNTTLIATQDPLQFVGEYFKDFLNDIYTHEINEQIQYKSTAHILKIYQKEIDDLQKQKHAYEASLENLKKTHQNNDNNQDKKNKKQKKKVTTKDDIDKKIQDFDDQCVKIKFPDFGHINSLAHAKKYADNMINFKMFRNPIIIESIPYDTFNVSDELLTLLFAGIGIYSSINSTICPNYLNTVLEMASRGYLAYIISDVSICYGTNYPINKVIAMQDFAINRSINTLFQLFGRAGRVGRSWTADIYVPDIVRDRIIEYSHHEKTTNVIEAVNMTNVFAQMIKYVSQLQSSKLTNLLDKYIVKPEQERLEKEQHEKEKFEQEKLKLEQEKLKLEQEKLQRFQNQGNNFGRNQEQRFQNQGNNIQNRNAIFNTNFNNQQNDNMNKYIVSSNELPQNDKVAPCWRRR